MSRPFSRVTSHRMVVSLIALVASIALVFAIGLVPAAAQDDAPEEVVIFVLDLSGSMNEPFDSDQTKLDIAKEAFVEAFTNVSPDARVGLRTYGDQIEPTDPANREDSCTNDTRLAAPIAPLQREQLISQVQSFTALGDTPMGLALSAAATDIPAGSTGTIVLFSDGRDECYDADLDGDPAQGPSFGEDPCTIARSLTDGSGDIDRVVTVGFRADAAAEAELRCIAESTGGSYTSIETPEDARDALPELLVNLSAPREAQLQGGQAIEGGSTVDTAADFVRLEEINADALLYTDSIDMNSRRIYRLDEFGPEGGTFTATVFGLPAESGIVLDMWMYAPRLNKDFFIGEHADLDAGMPLRPTASIRCTDCTITGGPYETYFVVSLTSPDPALVGTYELEVLTEGPGFGGPSTSCIAPQACFYPYEIEQRANELQVIEEELSTGTTLQASPELLAERDQLRDQFTEDQAAISSANDRAALLEERIPLAPSAGTSWTLPLLLIALGAGLAFAPVQKLVRGSSDTDDDEEGSLDQAESAATGPSLEDVGPTPAVSPDRGPGYDWDAELEAAKEALAGQRPERTAAEQDPDLPSYALTPEELAVAADADAAEAGETPPKRSIGQLAAERAAAREQAGEESAADAQSAAAQQTDAAQQTVAAQQAEASSVQPEQAAATQQAQEAAAQQAAATQQAQEAAAQQAAATQAAATQQAEQATPPASWYPDPSQEGMFRWWDGTGWTAHTSDGQGGAPA